MHDAQAHSARTTSRPFTTPEESGIKVGVVEIGIGDEYHWNRIPAISRDRASRAYIAELQDILAKGRRGTVHSNKSEVLE